MTNLSELNLNVVLCPGCGTRVAKLNTGVCPRCGWTKSDGPLLTIAEFIKKQTFPALGALHLGDVSPAFILAVRTIGAGLPPPAFEHGGVARAPADGPLWKTTIDIWTPFNPAHMEIEDLARATTSRDAYCSSQLVEEVTDPAEFPKTDFFGDHLADKEREEE